MISSYKFRLIYYASHFFRYYLGLPYIKFYLFQDASQSNDSGNENELMSLLQKDKLPKSKYSFVFFGRAIIYPGAINNNVLYFLD